MRKVVLIACVLFISGCATAYQKSGATGGFSETHLKDDIWRVEFVGNGYTTRETVQTYWLYRCSELAIKKGYDGFQILSRIQLSQNTAKEKYATDTGPFLKTSTPIFIPLYMGDFDRPTIEADIRLISGAVVEYPPVVFDAYKLNKELDPIVNAKNKCDRNNVCPHIHGYLYPDNRFGQGDHEKNKRVQKKTKQKIAPDSI